MKSATLPSRQAGGFTLIELLIVVAIIAILAAIAVPNFLEAQARSKISRVRADMRSVATALEAYGADYNHYPPVKDAFSPSYQARLAPLTTPVAFLTTLPRDPFSRNGTTWTGALTEGDSPDMYGYNTAAAAFGLSGAAPNSELHKSWSLTSGGPDGVIGFPYYAFAESFISTDRYIIFVYDTTNGTVSPGEIFRRGGRAFMPLAGLD